MTSRKRSAMCDAFEVLHYTLCDGWVNCWTVLDADGREVPKTFPTHEDAQAALDEFLAEIAAEIAAGDRKPDDGYDTGEYAVVDTA